MTEWENQINNYYRLLLNNKLIEKKFVEQSQKKWLEYKISNYKMINQLVEMLYMLYYISSLLGEAPGIVLL